MSIRIIPDEAVALLVEGSDGRIRNFLAGLALAGCDSDRESAEALIRGTRAVEFATPGSRPHAIHHAVVIEAGDGRSYWFGCPGSFRAGRAVADPRQNEDPAAGTPPVLLLPRPCAADGRCMDGGPRQGGQDSNPLTPRMT